jgi:hypothetical protein
MLRSISIKQCDSCVSGVSGEYHCIRHMEEESGYQQVYREEERHCEMKHHEETVN